MYDVVIIGAGVIGGMIARKLAAYEGKICILEKNNDVATGASAANSAIIHAGFDAKEGSLKAKMNVKGAEMMENVCRELGVKYRKNGSIVVGFSEEDRKTIGELCERGKKNGVKELRVVDGDEARRIEPNLSKNVTCALIAPTAGIVCPYELTIAAVGNAMDNGAELKRNFEVTGIEKRGDVYRVTAKNGEHAEAKYIVNAAGLYSDVIAKMVGDDSFTVHPRRGEYIIMDKRCGGLTDHTIFRTPSKMGKGILVTPTVDGNLLAGPTSVDTEDKDDRKTTAEGLALIMKEAPEDIDGIRFGQSITSFCGLRAVGSTGDFIINVPKENFVNVAGIESPGLSSSPAIAEYVAELLRGAGMMLTPKRDFDPIRPAAHAFREMSIGEKNEIIKRDPTYGHIVCRCESVTEGEIREALRREPKPLDMDGIKRRTRAQMGRCQGGFCSPLVAQLLAEATGKPFAEVTKCGGKSYLNLQKTKEI